MKQLSKIIQNSISLFKEALITSFKTFTSIFNYHNIRSQDINNYLSLKTETMNESSGPYIYTIFFKPPENAFFHVLDIIQSSFFRKIIYDITKKSPNLILSFQFTSNICINNQLRVFDHNYQEILENLQQLNNENKIEELINKLSDNITANIIDNYNSDLISISTIKILVTLKSKNFYLKDFEAYLRKN